MKRFILSVLAVSVFFLGVGALVEQTGAKFKSDEKALDLVRKARLAIGGDPAIAAVQSMRIVGRTKQTINVNGVERVEEGTTEIAMQFPDKYSKILKMGIDNGTGNANWVTDKQVDVVVMGDAKDKMHVRVDADGTPGDVKHRIVMKKDDGTLVELTGDDAVKWIAKENPEGGENKMILRKHPDGTAGGTEHRIVMKKDDGTVVELTGDDAKKWIAKEHPGMGAGEHEIILKKNADGTVTKIDGPDAEKVFVRKADGGNATFTTKDDNTVALGDKHFVFERSNGLGGELRAAARGNDMLRLTLSLLMTSPKGMDVEYTYGGEGNIDGRACNIVVASYGGQAYKLFLDRISNLPVAINYKGAPVPKVIHFEKAMNAPSDGTKADLVFKKMGASGPVELAEYQVRFSDYRSVSGVLLPYQWAQTVGGKADEVFEVTSYEVNPPNISERFSQPRVMVREIKPDGK
ncbi:MAG: hypothetical protein AB7J13_05200 [Pyrinomonadaceae bacterium]